MSIWIFITVKLYRFWARYVLFIRKMLDLFCIFQQKSVFLQRNSDLGKLR